MTTPVVTDLHDIDVRAARYLAQGHTGRGAWSRLMLDFPSTHSNVIAERVALAIITHNRHA